MDTWSLLKYCIIALSLTSKVSSQIDDSCVETLSGNVKGSLINLNGHDVLQYLGIPYAKPPVGDLRFKKTQPVDPWNGTLMANQWPPACMQYNEYSFLGDDTEDGESEDCLYLNIWVPRSTLNANNTKIPVMFWIHGGFFTIGSSRLAEYNGQALAAVGEIIVVTINYRLNVFGFFIAHTESAPGNAALYDVLEALKWVNKNIGAFGGDPSQVTLAGESSGAILVGYFCVSPLSKGLFHRVIMQSGSPAYFGSDISPDNIKKSQELAEALGCADYNKSIRTDPEAVVTCMKGVDAFQIVATQAAIFPLENCPFYPNFGDEILPQNARLAIINSQFHKVDVLIGINRDEGTALTALVLHYQDGESPQINRTYGEMTLRRSLSRLPLSQFIVRYYLRDVQENDSFKVFQRISAASGDFILVCPTVYFAERYSQAGNKVYFYFFAHRPSTTPWPEWVGATHYEEVQFVFGLPLQRPENYTDEEIFLSNRMIRVWSNWIKVGEPPERNWPLYSRKDPNYVIMDTKLEPRYGKGPHRNNCNFFRFYFGFIF